MGANSGDNAVVVMMATLDQFGFRSKRPSRGLLARPRDVVTDNFQKILYEKSVAPRSGWVLTGDHDTRRPHQALDGMMLDQAYFQPQ
jgi:hypothetical protein